MKLFLYTMFLCSSLSAQAQLNLTTQITPVTTTLLGIHFADTSLGYACGDAGVILKTSNGGQTWTQLTTGTTSNLWDIKVIPNSAGQKLIVVGDNNTILKSMDGGSSWQPQISPFAAGSFVFGIQCIDSLNYYACGGDFATLSGAVLKTTNGGQTWTLIPVPNTKFLDKVFMTGSTGYTVGNNTTFTDGSINKTTNAAAAWITSTTSPSIITNVWAHSVTGAVAVGLGGQIWKTANSGTNWSTHNYNTTDLYGIQMIDSLHGYACGGDQSSSIILHTTASGTGWTQLPYTSTGILFSLHAIGGYLYVCGDMGKIIKGTPVVSGIENVDRTNIAVFPNPATSSFQVKAKQEQIGSIRLLSMDGKTARVWEKAMDNYSLENIPAGIYLVEVRNSSNELIYSERLTRQ